MQRPDPDISQRSTHILRSTKKRRPFAVVGMLFALGLILSVTLYAIYANQTSPNAFSKITTVLHSIVGTSAPASTCTTPSHDPGNSTVSITSGGLQRTMLIHLPPSYGIQPQALVINYHGYSSSAQNMAAYSQMPAEADKAGFVLVFPQGIDDPSSWNAGINGQGVPTGTADDVQFTRDMLKFLTKNYCINSHHIYVAGYSIGGGMAYRVACTLTNQIAALATVAGAFYHAPGGCQPSRPLPILEIHGQADGYAPYNGNSYQGMAAVQVYLNVWLNYDQCTGDPQSIFQQGDVTGITWKHCADGTVVTHYRISDGGHTWPGGGTISFLGYNTHVINANEVIWNFFNQYST